MAEYESITEERIEMMVSPSGEFPNLKLSHFLNSSFTSIDGRHRPALNLPSDAFSIEDEEKVRQRLKFHMWKNPKNQWKTWVLRMHSLHESVWRRAGIYDAIMNSVNDIKPDEHLFLALIERWCPKTNTFVFPWGEATITLEDVMVLGGYSVLGDPFFSPLQTGEMIDTERQLILARLEISRSKAKKVHQSLWLSRFMASGSEIEHEAFLSLWLSRFVFPLITSGNTVPKRVLPIAVHLARGTKIALAPVVLAGIYSNLSKLKNGDSASKKSSKITAPLQLVQIWAWERFPTLQPTPPNNNLGPDHVPRFYKWSGLKRAVSNVKLAIANAADHFNWRPYQVDDKSIFSSKIHRNNKENQTWVLLDMDDEVQEVIIRCVRVSELVGMDCIEQYLPHRVAMQFGLDQDLPNHVPRTNASQMVAWVNYNRPIRGGRLIVLSYLSGSDITRNVTLQYWQSWESMISDANSEKLKRKSYKSVFANAAVYKNFLKNKYMKSGNDNDSNLVPPAGFPSKSKAKSGRSTDNDDSGSPN